jgi:hypothetical protein
MPSVIRKWQVLASTAPPVVTRCALSIRFAVKERFFWDERAASVEEQTTMPLQDHVEMGFSGNNGDPGLDSLLIKIADLEYYQMLFAFVYGDPDMTEERLQLALAQFIRSIQSFDSRFDDGLVKAGGEIQEPFANFSQTENDGKRLFLAHRFLTTTAIAPVVASVVPAVMSHPNSTSNSTPGTMALPKAERRKRLRHHPRSHAAGYGKRQRRSAWRPDAHRFHYFPG